MKKLFILTAVIATVFVFSNCSSTKKVAATKAVMTYEGNMQAVIQANCSPCHIPAKGGFKKAYDNFGSVKADIDEMIRRIELNPGERGVMPFKKTEKLSDSTIAIFKQWKADGLNEK
jgi:mono/diheme cytochrome c family protein